MRSTLTDDLTDHEVAVGSRDPLSHMTIHRYRVQSVDLGDSGSVEGGTLLDWIHGAAHATAARWSGRCCVAASIGNFHLDRPIRAAELVEVHACLVYTGHSSVHVLVTVYSGDPTGANSVQSTQCPIVFVAVDDVGEPAAVPPWTPFTMLELRRHHQARVRIRTRRQIEDAVAAQTYTAAGTAPRASRHILVARADVHTDGAVHGGRVMRWIDEVANACAAEWSTVQGVTSYVAAIRFCRAIAVGDRLEVTARIVHTGRRSIHVGVRMTTSDMVTGAVQVAAEGLLVVVSLDEQGRARCVPRWVPDCAEDIRLDRHAQRLVELRQLYEPYPATAGVPPSLVGSVVARERGVEEREL